MLNLILVDDDPDEAYIMRQALKQIDDENQLVHFENGPVFLSALKGYQSLANLILLDLNMPQQSGFDVLKEIKSHREYCNMPVVMYSNSNSPQDIETSYISGANSYVRKPQGLNETKDFLKSLIDYWQRINRT